MDRDTCRKLFSPSHISVHQFGTHGRQVCRIPIYRTFGCREQPKSVQGCLERVLYIGILRACRFWRTEHEPNLPGEYQKILFAI